jgi:hypothetical protein
VLVLGLVLVLVLVLEYLAVLEYCAWHCAWYCCLLRAACCVLLARYLLVSRRGCDATKSLILGGAPMMALDPVHPSTPFTPFTPSTPVPPWFKALLACTPPTCGPPSPLRLPQLKPRFHLRVSPAPTRPLGTYYVVAALMLPPCCRRAAANLPDSRAPMPCSPSPCSHVRRVAPTRSMITYMFCPYCPTSAYADAPPPLALVHVCP